jgi:uncharacterized membrane protein YdbT with pleckstrin-like domain
MATESAAVAPLSGQKASKAASAILAAMGFGALIAQMFSTVIGPALPTIKDDLGLGLSAQTWTITAYNAIKDAVTSAASGAITVSMLVLAAVALAGVFFAWGVIGRRRTPEYIETTNAAAV